MSSYLNISVSGIDFTGKSTLAGKLADALSAKLFVFPSKETKAGIDARNSLSDKNITFKEREMLFLKDAYINGVLIKDLGVPVVTDRSPLCQMAYRDALGLDPTPYMQDIIKVGGFVPNLVILLTVNEDTLKERMVNRGTPKDVLESVSIGHMMRRQKGYENIFFMFKIHHIVIATDNKTPEEILQETIEKIEIFMNEVRINNGFKMKENEFYTG